MRKSIKCGIVAAVVVAAGFASYQSYGVYSIQNNSLLMQNVEALATGTESNAKKLPAHKCNTFGDENPGFDAFSKQRAYICSNGHETTKEKAYNQQIKCSYYGFKRWGGVQVKIISTGAFFDYKTTYQRILIIWGCAGTSPYLQI